MELLEDIVYKVKEKIPEIEDLGLLYGKMGIAVFFFHYAQHTGLKKYEDTGNELIESIFEDVNEITPVNFVSGLAGIGVGIEYLLQNKFIAGNGNEILEEIDECIFEELIYRENIDCSLEYGLCGLGKYYLYRVNNKESYQEDLLTVRNRQNIIYLLDRLESKKELSVVNPQQILHLLIQLYNVNVFNVKVEKLIRFFQNDYKTELLKLKKDTILKTNEITKSLLFAQPEGIGLSKGLIKTGLSLMSYQDRSSLNWIDLIF